MITNDEAMQELARDKARSTDSGAPDPYWRGVLMGEAGAYWKAGVISYEQYIQLTEPNHIVGVNNMVAPA